MSEEENKQKNVLIKITHDGSDFAKFLIDSIKEYIEKTEDRHDRKIGLYWATDIVNCLRKAFYLYTIGLDYDEVNGYVLLGKIIHEAVEQVLGFKGFKTEQEVLYKGNGYYIKGRIDAIKDGTVVEIKTSKYKEIESKDYFKKYLMQLAFYVYATNSREGYIVVINKLDFHIKVYRFSKEELKQYFEEFLARANLLHQAIKSKTPPEPEIGFECTTCPFRDICRAGKNKEKNNSLKLFL